ncbi:MAG: hypothetical protein DRQ55_15010 [Planctomycetota bacterium]|nr:MAG: hypothetical protein DRQ55_15010 [Planctomycetota bacterium]
MASAKPAATSRRNTSGKGPKKSDEPEISPARWGGVALVIAAIIAAITLAVISPSDPDTTAQPGIAGVDSTPTPAPSVLDTRVPTAQPTIVSPGEGPTPEYEISVTVAVPEEEDIPRKDLTLVVLRGDEELGKVLKPKPGTKVKVEGVRLLKGSENELTAALKGPGGLLGPRSNPVLVTQDPDAPSLAITSPAKGYDTYDKTVIVAGTSEVGAEVRITNEANSFGPKTVVVPASGEFSISVPLKVGPNRILAESENQIGQTQPRRIKVVRKDGRPTIDNVKYPRRIPKSTLPKTIRVVVDVVDSKGKEMEGATVAYTLGAPGYPAVKADEETGPNGHSVWNVRVEPSDALTDTLELSVTVTSPRGDQKTERYKITLT